MDQARFYGFNPQSHEVEGLLRQLQQRMSWQCQLLCDFSAAADVYEADVIVVPAHKACGRAKRGLGTGTV